MATDEILAISIPVSIFVFVLYSYLTYKEPKK